MSYKNKRSVNFLVLIFPVLIVSGLLGWIVGAPNLLLYTLLNTLAITMTIVQTYVLGLRVTVVELILAVVSCAVLTQFMPPGFQSFLVAILLASISFAIGEGCSFVFSKLKKLKK